MDLLSPFAEIARKPVLTDVFGREITYLRLSVTDRCNLRCLYCMGKAVKFLPKAEVLSLEEIERLCAAFIRLGVRKLRLTGGEPLLRRGVMGLIERLGERVASGELDELTLTTNGTLLASHAPALAAAGVRRVNVSLDTLSGASFRHIAQRSGLAEVLAGIDAARSAGLAVRINAVALAGINDLEFDSLIRWCGEHGCDLALIEMMPLGGLPPVRYLSLDVVRRELAERWTLTPVDRGAGKPDGGPCRYWEVLETGRRVGFIAPRSHGFCKDCNRVRVTCTGALVACMAQPGDIDLRAALRRSESDDGLEAAIVAAVKDKPAGHQFNVCGAPGATQRMWQLGG
jgi:cyclic pyranopterin phosphate synthase